jgi:hypothetical protein
MRHTGKGYPHIRLFELSEDLKRILWFSSSKSIEESFVDLTRVLNITMGQTTDNFTSYPLPSLSHLSFSVHVQRKKSKKIDTFDLTAKDELEFDLWITGIRALSYHWRHFFISKMQLLGHSRVFNEMLKEKKIGQSSKFMMHGNDQVYQSKKLIDCLSRKPMTCNELDEKMKQLNKRLRGL